MLALVRDELALKPLMGDFGDVNLPRVGGHQG